MLVVAAGATALGQWAEGGLFLFSLGHSLEDCAIARARRTIEALTKLAPDTATVALSVLQIGDVVVVRSNERLPADGAVRNVSMTLLHPAS